MNMILYIQMLVKYCLKCRSTQTSVMPYHFTHYLFQAFPHYLKLCKNIKMYTDIVIYRYRVMTGKYKCHMACNSYDVEKMFMGDTEVYTLQKMIFGPYQ